MPEVPESSPISLVKPETLKGFRDYLPADMIPRQHIVDRIRRVYERYGFSPVDTPVLESLETLVGSGGEEVNKELFRLESPEGNPVAMRFDLTVPFARLIAQYPDTIKLPFRRYHIGPVFRADKPGIGRYRQFTQFDIDIAGSDSVVADAEIVAAMCEAFRSLGLRRETEQGVAEYCIRMNNRRLVDALLESCGIAGEETHRHILRVIDKLQKVGVENIRRELGPGRVDDSGDPIRGVGLEAAAIDRILAFVALKGATRAEVVDQLTGALGAGESAEAALAETRQLAAALDALGVSEAEAVLDPSLARGLDYYTGPVYEAFLPGAPQFGSVMGGGRYDRLVARFLETPIPACGASIGLDRLTAALAEIGRVESLRTATRVFIVAMNGVEATDLLTLARELRDAGIPSEIYMGPKAGMRKQMSHADALEIPVAIIAGPDEIAAGQVSIKNLFEGKQRRSGIDDHAQYVKAGKAGQVTVSRGEMLPAVRAMLADAGLGADAGFGAEPA